MKPVLILQARPETEAADAELAAILRKSGLSEDDLARRLAPGALDHFCRARLMQHVETLHVRDEESRARLESRLSTLRRSIVGWLRPFSGASSTPRNSAGAC